jgi:acetyl-CoA synthetase
MWDAARRNLDGFPGGGINMACEAVDRHARGRLGATAAFRFLRPSGERLDTTYAEPARLTNRFANLLRGLGVDIPESDYAKLVTLEDILAYLARKRPAR